jgi:hypothetical protein
LAQLSHSLQDAGGDRVRLWPNGRADIMDTALEGKTAVIEAIEQDFEDNVQLAVVVEDDPGHDLGQVGRAATGFSFRQPRSSLCAIRDDGIDSDRRYRQPSLMATMGSAWL